MAVDARPIAIPIAVPAARPRGRGRFDDVPIMPTAILLLLVLTALFADVLAPYDPTLPVAGTRSSSHRSGWMAETAARCLAPTFRAATP